MSDRVYADVDPASNENFVTIAQACHGVLTKTNYGNGSQRSYDHVKYFNFEEYECTTLYDLYTLSIGMLTQPKCCFIRARIKDESNATHVVRKSNSVEATLIVNKCNWFALDIDWSRESSGNLKIDAQETIHALPEWLHKAEYFAVASASYQFKPGIRMRLFFWANQPVSGVDLKNAFKDYKKIADDAIFNPIQLIYTAAPLGVDPVQDRIVWKSPLFGDGKVNVPITDYSNIRGAPEIWYTRARAEMNLHNHLLRITLLAPGERHPGLITEGIPLGKLVGHGYYEREWMIDQAMIACDEWHGHRNIKHDYETIRYAVDVGIKAMEDS